MLKGIKNKINRIYVVGNGIRINWKETLKSPHGNKPGLLLIEMPDNILDEYITVLALVLDGKLQIQE